METKKGMLASLNRVLSPVTTVITILAAIATAISSFYTYQRELVTDDKLEKYVEEQNKEVLDEIDDLRGKFLVVQLELKLRMIEEVLRDKCLRAWELREQLSMKNLSRHEVQELQDHLSTVEREIGYLEVEKKALIEKKIKGQE